MKWVALFLIFLNGLVLATHYVEHQKKLQKETRLAAIPEKATLLTLSEVMMQAAGEYPGGEKGESQRCLLAGPMDLELRATTVIDALKEKGLEARLYTNTLELAPEFWVYLPPFETRAEALEKLRELQEKKIDSYLINQGELRNGISLGFFRNSDTAELLLSRRQRQGYEALLKAVPKTKTEYWVLLMTGFSDGMAAMLEEISEAVSVPLQSREILCAGVAS